MSVDDEIDEVPETGSGMRKGRRPGIAVHNHNPFIKGALAETKSGTKRISSRDGNRFMVVSDSGEIMAPAGFHEIVEVDKSKFVKLYAQGVRAFAGLSPAGAKVFEVLYVEIAGRPGVDRLWIHYNDVDQTQMPMSVATFKRGLRELLLADFIAESDRQGMYWLNLQFLFNGNRLAFVKEYRIKGSAEEKSKQELLEAQELQRLLENDPQGGEKVTTEATQTHQRKAEKVNSKTQKSPETQAKLDRLASVAKRLSEDPTFGSGPEWEKKVDKMFEKMDPEVLATLSAGRPYKP